MSDDTQPPGPWDLSALMSPPQVHEAPGFSGEGVRPLFFDALPYQGRPTRAFAWLGYPDGYKEGDTVPGMVLVHGGGGTAFEEWVRMWTARGYAAIAMDTCGGTPRGDPPPRPRHEYSGPAGWGGFDQIEQDVHDQWTFHAVAAVILAHSLLRSQPGVDPERIGLTGISWGGFLTCIVAGLDHRFRFAAPVYGCGFLGENSIWLDTLKNMGEAKAKRWLELWDPSNYLPNANLPMLWATGTNDEPYPMDSRQKSYRLPPGPRTLSIKPEMTHGHPDGQDVPEIFAFADAHLRGGHALTYVHPHARNGRDAWVPFEPTTEVERVALQYTCDAGPWKERCWHTTEAQIDRTPRRPSTMIPEVATARIPDDTTAFFFNVISRDGLIVSSEHEEL